jgi:hypothetical protein
MADDILGWMVLRIFYVSAIGASGGILHSSWIILKEPSK